MLRLKVTDMTCGHCARTVTKAVHSVDHGAAVNVDLGTGEVTVRGKADASIVTAAIATAGYQVEQQTE